MAGIYIPGMEMPQPGEAITIFCSGDAHRFIIGMREALTKSNAIAVPDHGRLVDVDEVCNRLLTLWDTADKEKKVLISAVLADVVTPIVVGTPTIIPADKERSE